MFSVAPKAGRRMDKMPKMQEEDIREEKHRIRELEEIWGTVSFNPLILQKMGT